MKTKLCTVLLVLLGTNIINSQAITLTFANPQITNDGTDDFYEADILIASTTDFYLGSGQVYLDYNTAAFGSNISANNNLDYGRPAGAILAHSFGMFSPAYKDFVQNDNTASRVSLSFQQNIALAGLQTATAIQVTSTPKVLLHIKIRYTNAVEAPGIRFFSDGVFQDQFFTACGGTAIADCTNNPGTQITDDSYSSSGAAFQSTGKLVISEIMKNPSGVTDANGEYFELYNDETSPVNLQGWTVSDGGTDTHTIGNGLIVKPDGFIVLGRNSNSTTNGGVTVHYQYSGIAMDNTADEIILTNGASTEIDRVEYDGGTNWPNPDGKAMIYTGSNIENNNSGALWQAATAAEGISPDLGSPGSNGKGQIVDWLVFDTNAWNRNPSGSTGAKNALIRESEALTLGSDISLLSLTVEPDADVTVSSSVTLSITDIILESTSTEYSSLISDGTLSGTTVTYRRHVNQTATSGGNDLISPPVTGGSFDGLLAANGNIPSNTAGTIYLFGPFDKTSGTYTNYSSTATDALTPGVGYRAATTDNGTLEFSGGINQSNVSVAISDSGPLEFSKWNLVGNPYPSYINVQAFLNNATNAALLEANNVAIYGYDGDASDGWTVHNLNSSTSATVITPGQGFFVAAGSDGNISFTTGMRSHGSTDDFISGRSTDDNRHLRLQLSGNGNVSHTDLYFNGSSTYGLDPGYDAGAFGDVAGAFSICSRLVADDLGVDIAIQSLPQDIFASDELVPLGINASAGTVLTIGIESSDLPQGVDIYLVDVQEQQVAHLNTEDFGITPTGDLNGTGRFYLGFSNGVLSTGSHEIDRVRVYAREGHILIEGQLIEDTEFGLYDIQGRLVMQGALEPHVTVRHIETGALNDGVYLVELNNGHVRKTHKVILD
ncbi:lamin tail domain-containing protein [Winogradskyella sp.]|uniref:lamin tail domain-containing protein n=1 Tax=Winogradskyella sp. TaxID=1883156 RepID=UPI003BAA8CDB